RPVGGDRRDGELDAVGRGLAPEQHERLSIVPASDYLGLGAGSERRSRWRRYEYRCSIGVGERLVQVGVGEPSCPVEVVDDGDTCEPFEMEREDHLTQRIWLDDCAADQPPGSPRD